MLPRLHARWQLRRGCSLTEVATLIGVTYRTVPPWVAWYRQGGRAEVTRHQQGGGAPARVTVEPRQALNAQVDTGVFRTPWDAIPWIREQDGVAYTYWGMRHVFARLRLKKQMPRPQNPKASEGEHAAWKKKGVAPNSRRQA